MAAEIYIIKERITPEDLVKFIKRYICGFTPMATVYEYPQHRKETEFRTDRAEVMMDYLIENGKTGYRFYFSNLQFTEEVQNGIVIFNEDYSLTLGIWVPEELEEKYADQLRLDFKTNLAVITYNTLPPDNYNEFRKVALGV